ncbi:YggT family protein [Chromobacterium subtsugae]|uniref:YggT family protein n=1 Tax=Chromobacterium subtsugae TaxID=251747 RepID=A0ABS7F7U3_9NEIS|nr:MULTISPECIES: YggT family protein [Chromobacterium]KUM05432.1 osmotic-shock protein [Chromobacterium subtsugae]KZE83225.1 osmotic-shock protein [Chromobacterium sp. F49]MBW7567190.1 YggT family protein [Chromobacterium subtsugae]MBW8286160.1 YggT family protein [Chromobacterium subtsugae]OBU87925.1 integral membrane protein YggT, involved in response to extracytoplasmic stress (osmotic shock) [Chromobacterium subtsugae]
MFVDTLQFLIKTLSGLFVLVLLLRFYLQVARAPFKHPLCQFVMAATNFLVLPTRKLVPSVRNYDTATLLLAWLVCLLANILRLLLGSLPEVFAFPQVWVSLFLLSVLEVFKQSLTLLMGAVVVQAVLSWVNPYNPIAPVLDSLTRPFLRPFRRAVVGGVDLSPLVLLLIIQVIMMLPVQALEAGFLTQLKVVLQ